MVIIVDPNIGVQHSAHVESISDVPACSIQFARWQVETQRFASISAISSSFFAWKFAWCWTRTLQQLWSGNRSHAWDHVFDCEYIWRLWIWGLLYESDSMHYLNYFCVLWSHLTWHLEQEWTSCFFPSAIVMRSVGGSEVSISIRANLWSWSFKLSWFLDKRDVNKV